MIYAVGICEHSDRADPSVVENVEVFERRLVAGLHSADGGSNGVHIACGLTERSPRVTDGLQHGQNTGIVIAVGRQRLAHGRQVIVEERRGVRHLHEVGKILLCLILTLEEGGKGDLVGLPGRCQRAAGGQRVGLLVQLPLHGLLHIGLEGGIARLIALQRA